MLNIQDLHVSQLMFRRDLLYSGETSDVIEISENT